MVITMRAGVQKFLPVFRGRFFEAMMINSYRCQGLINCFGEGRSLILRTAPQFCENWQRRRLAPLLSRLPVIQYIGYMSFTDNVGV